MNMAPPPSFSGCGVEIASRGVRCASQEPLPAQDDRPSRIARRRDPGDPRTSLLFARSPWPIRWLAVSGAIAVSQALLPSVCFSWDRRRLGGAPQALRRALLHRQDSARRASPAATGLFSMYRMAVAR